jgi:hypothetical protein
MKYLKSFFEELDLSNRNITFDKIKEDSYEFTTDELTYKVDFIPSFTKEYKSCWSRQYDLKANREIGFHQSNKNPFKILSTVTEITKDFLKEKDVEVLIIMHTLMENENCPIDKLNKRAKINYQYLKAIDEYQIKYFNQPFFLSGDKSVCTNCIMFKKEIDINPIIEMWNRFKPHFEVIVK